MTTAYANRLDTQNPGSEEANVAILPLILLGIALCLVFVTARDGLGNLFERWTQEDEYGYGFLIVTLVPLLLWNKWQLVEGTRDSARWPGTAILVAGQVCAILSILGESFFLEQLSLVVSLLGIGLAFFGAQSHRLFFPIAILLLLSIPLPYTLQAMLTIKLQLLSTDIGVYIIRFLGIPVFVDGNIIDLGVYKLQVAEACSGLRYLLPLIGISYLVAYLYKATFWKKAFVVLSAAPITVAINSFRIAVTAALVNRFGIEMAEGFLHEFEGWIVFLLGILLLACVIIVLERFRLRNVEIQPLFRRPELSKRASWFAGSLFPAFVIVFVCAATLTSATSIAFAFRSLTPPPRALFVDFPERVGAWKVQPQTIQSAEIVRQLKSSDGYLADFTTGETRSPVNLFVAYYDSLNKNAAIHSPRVCLPGSGWEFSLFQEKSFSELMPGAQGTYNYVIIQKGTQRILMYYWYQQRQRRTANEFSMKYYLLVDSFLQSRKDGGLVRIYTPIVNTDGERAEELADARLRSFINSALPILPQYLPQ